MFSLQAIASATFTLPATATPPPHFSGTNCKVDAKVDDDPIMIGGIQKAELYIIGTVSGAVQQTKVASWIKIYQEPVGGNELPPLTVSVTLTAYFASNHFDHGTMVKLRMRALDEAGIWYESHPPLQGQNLTDSYNKGLIANNGQGGVCWTTANNKLLNPMKHVNVVHDHDGWTEATWLNELATSTAIHVSTHGQGNPTSLIYDDTNLAGNDHEITDTDVAATRTAANSNNIPHVNIGWIDACFVTSIGTTFLEALNTGTIGAPAPVDRAAVGYGFFVWLPCADPAGIAFWTQLRISKTAKEARDKAFYEYNKVMYDNPTQYENTPKLLPSQMVLFGDPYTRMYGVYTGNNTLPTTTWYRSEPPITTEAPQ